MDYCEERDGVTYHWHHVRRIHDQITHRGTHLELVERPRWGMTCYMNGEIQSCEADERLYHELLVHPARVHTVDPRRVLILGGGEGATAREVLKIPTVDHVDMYEWDEDVVNVFRTNGRQWAQGAWEDPRLHLHFQDAFTVLEPPPTQPYDMILIDLFEPEDHPALWSLVLRLVQYALAPHGVLSMYAGILDPFDVTYPSERMMAPERMEEYSEAGLSLNHVLRHRHFLSYKTYIPSFSGEAMFLMIHMENIIPQWSSLLPLRSHLTRYLWQSYETWFEESLPLEHEAGEQ